MHVVDEKDLLEAVKNGACPHEVLSLFDYVLVDGYLISSDTYLLIPEYRNRIKKALEGRKNGKPSP